IHVQRALGLQAAAPAVTAVNGLEIGKLTIHAAAAPQSGALRKTELRGDPRRGGRCRGRTPVVDTCAWRYGHSRAETDPNLPVRRAGRGAFVVVVQRNLRARGRQLSLDGSTSVEPLGVAAEFDEHARPRQKGGLGPPPELAGPSGIEHRPVAIVVLVSQAGPKQTLSDRKLRARQVPPRQRRQPRATDAGLDLVHADTRIALVESRAAQERDD